MKSFVKLISLFLTFLMILSVVQLAAFAATEGTTKEYSAINCDSSEGWSTSASSGIVLDTSNKQEGTSSVSITFNTNSMLVNNATNLVIVSCRLDTPVSVLESNRFTCDLYISNVDFLKEIDSAQFELTSSGTCDQQEIGFMFPADFGTLQNGWNKVNLDLSACIHADNGFDDSNFNFFRLYIWFKSELATDRDITLKFDDFRFIADNYVEPDPVIEPVVDPTVAIGCESTANWSIWGSEYLSVSLDAVEKTQGNASIRFDFNTASIDASSDNPLIVFEYHAPEAYNASGCNAFEFDFYINDVTYLDEISSSQFELTSGGGCDVEELNWAPNEIFSDVQNGWNHIIILVDTGDTTGSDFDISRFNYLRWYMFLNKSKAQDRNVVIRFDNMCFTYRATDISLASCDTATGITSTVELSVDTTGKVEGDGALMWKLDAATDSSFELYIPVENVYAIWDNALIIDLYISNNNFLRNWDATLYAELSSGTGKGSDCYKWNLNTDAASPLMVGWNKVELFFNSASEVIGSPDLSNVTGFYLYIDSISAEDTSTQTVMRLDDVHVDIATLHLGIITDNGLGVPNGRIYDDDDGITTPVETEAESTKSETGTETQATESETTGDSGLAGGGTMLDDADKDASQNTYTTAHAKKVAGILATILVIGSAGISVLAVVFHVTKVK